MSRKICGCGDEFTPPKGNESIKSCGPCTYEKYRIKKLEYKYGLSEGEYMRLYEDQRGSCAICGVHESKLAKRLHVDHDHSCCPDRKACGKCVRGLLCAKCNTSIGQFESEPTRLLIAYDYLTGGESD